MAAKKLTAPFHKVLAAHIREVDGPDYNTDEQLGVQKFLSSLLGGRTDPKIKPVTVPGWHDGIIEEYAILSSNLGAKDDNRTLTVLAELKRQKKVAKAKRAK